MAAAVPFIGYSALAGASMLGAEIALLFKDRHSWSGGITKVAIFALAIFSSGALLFASAAALASLTSSVAYLTLGITGTTLLLGALQFVLLRAQARWSD